MINFSVLSVTLCSLYGYAFSYFAINTRMERGPSE